MKCPVCQAKLLPVDGDLFCLQCGDLVKGGVQDAGEGPKLEETSDPILRRAISDSIDSTVNFTVPEDGAVARVDSVLSRAAPAKPRTSFFSLHKVLVPVRPAVVSAAGGGQMPMGAVPAEPMAEVKAPVPVTEATVAVTGAKAEQAAAPSAPAVPAKQAAPASAPVSTQATTQTVSVAVAAPQEAPAQVAAPTAPKSATASLAWVWGVMGAALLVAVNFGVGAYYTDRVYPGVKVANVAVGNLTFAELHSRLGAKLEQPKLSAAVGSQKFDLDLGGVGAVSMGNVERDAEQLGRSRAFPIVGVLGSWFKQPISPDYSLSDDAVARAVGRLAAQVDRAPSDAAPLVLGTKVILLADKPGAKLDAAGAAAAIRASYGHAKTVTVNLERVLPKVTAGDYAGELAAAQAIVGTAVQIKVRTATYTPTPDAVAGWIVFGGPGKGVSVDAAGAANFVKGIPGTFDRTGAVSGLVAALNAHNATVLTPSLKKRTGNPATASSLTAWPLAKFTYCVDSSVQAESLSASTEKTLGAAGSWALGGRIQYVLTGTNCNFSLRIADQAAMGALDLACANQTSCRIHNELVIKSSVWEKAPAGWKGDLNSYRTELVNHVVGQWLGFDHPGCNASNAQKPVLSAPDVTFATGCSPGWYAVPAELQDTKVLAGF